MLFFHLGIGGFQSGFIGVDVFFVISGYLITSLITKDLAQDKFSIVKFYERRMRRIFPALFTVLFFCILVASVLFYPEELTKFGKSLFTTTFFASNFYFWHSALDRGYFDTFAPPSPLLHTWSLAVEEQFYLLFPLILYLLFRWARRRAAAWLLLLIALSFALNLWATQYMPVVAFYWLMPRAWELLLGAFLAMNAIPLIRRRIPREIVALLGLAMILAAAALPLNRLRFPGYIALLPCIGAWLVIYSGEAGPTLVKKALSYRPILFIGVISYSLYLWHWPAIVFTRHLPFHPTGSLRVPLLLLFSVAAAFISFEYIERPFRGSTSPFSRSQVFALGLVASTLTAAFGLTAFRSAGLPQRYDARTRRLVMTNQDRVKDYDASCGNWKKEVRSLNDIKLCNLGAQLPHKIMFWGDSHVEQMYPDITRLYSRGELRKRGVVLAIEAGCFPDEHLNTMGEGFHCDSFARFAKVRAQSDDIDLVFLGFSTWLARWDNSTCLSTHEKCTTVLSRDALERQLVADLAEVIRDLKNRGKSVIVCLPFPIFNEPIPDVEINNAVFGRLGLEETPEDVTSPALREKIRVTALDAGAEIFDPRETICPQDHCITEVDGVAVYKDESHFAGSQVNILESSLRSVLQRNLVQPLPQN